MEVFSSEELSFIFPMFDDDEQLLMLMQVLLMSMMLSLCVASHTHDTCIGHLIFIDSFLRKPESFE